MRADQAHVGMAPQSIRASVGLVGVVGDAISSADGLAVACKGIATTTVAWLLGLFCFFNLVYWM